MNCLPKCGRLLTALVLLLAGGTVAAATPRRPWVVVSDIDDTIKETGVVRDVPAPRGTDAHPKNSAHLLGDPFRRWPAVPGMAERYAQWRARDGAEFVYLSKSPWFYRPRLAGFLRARGFPAGRILLNPCFPFAGPQYKDTALRKIVRAQPGAAFVFVGDTGESDPEIYGRIAREFPRAVRRVFIREVTHCDPPVRYRRAFAGVPRGRLFVRAAQLPAALDPSATLPARHVPSSQAHRR